MVIYALPSEGINVTQDLSVRPWSANQHTRQDNPFVRTLVLSNSSKSFPLGELTLTKGEWGQATWVRLRAGKKIGKSSKIMGFPTLLSNLTSVGGWGGGGAFHLPATSQQKHTVEIQDQMGISMGFMQTEQAMVSSGVVEWGVLLRAREAWGSETVLVCYIHVYMLF